MNKDKLYLMDKQEIEAYNTIVYKTMKLFNKLNLNDSFEIFYVFSYLLWNGYFSLNKNYKFTSDRQVLCDMFGMTIMTGSGVCLNNAELLDRIYKSLNYDSYIIATKKSKPIHNLYNSYINRTIEKKPSNSDSSLLSNHCCVLVKDNKYNYIYDPTNIICFYLNSKKTANIVNGSGGIKISFFDTAILSFRKYSEINNVFKKIYLKNKNQINFDNDINKKTRILYEFCENNLAIFNEFYESNINNIKTITNQLQKKKI